MYRCVVKRMLVLLFLSYSLFPFLPGCGAAIVGDQGIPSVPSGNAITLSWRAPERNSDGSLFTDLAGFNVYYGLRSGMYTDIKVVTGQTLCVIDELPGDTMLHLAVTAFDFSGNESDFSEEIQTYLPPL